MDKWHEFASSDPTQLTCGYTVGPDYSHRSTPVVSSLGWQNLSSLLWRPHGLLGVYGHLCNNSLVQHSDSVPSLALKSLQKSQWETLWDVTTLVGQQSCLLPPGQEVLLPARML